MAAEDGSETGSDGPYRQRGGARAAGGAKRYEAAQEGGGTTQVRPRLSIDCIRRWSGKSVFLHSLVGFHS